MRIYKAHKTQTLFAIILLISLQTGEQASSNYTVKPINGFLKAVEDSTHDLTYHCWNSTQTYRVTPNEFTAMCDDDPGFYQSCGQVNSASASSVAYNITSDILCSYYICAYHEPFLDLTSYKTGEYGYSLFHCNVNATCLNDHINLKYCDESLFRCTYSGQLISQSKVCDGIADCTWQEDELGCNHTYGIECTSNNSEVLPLNTTVWVEPATMCDPRHATNETKSVCNDNSDQVNSTTCGDDQFVGTCNYMYDYVTVTIETRDLFELQKCGPYPYTSSHRVCSDGSDQINCSNSDIVYSCSQKTTNSSITLTDIVLCEDLQLCDDDITNKCETPETDCKIHRHFLCDGIEDCESGLDEEQCNYLQTEIKCLRRIRNKTNEPTELYILREWVMDNVTDCENGEDEDRAIWNNCSYAGFPKPVYSYKNSDYACNFTFVCNNSGNAQSVLDPQEMCNGRKKEHCPIESKLCKISRSKEVNVTVLNNGPTQKFLPPCLPGLRMDSEYSFEDCFDYVLEESYGTVPITITGPKSMMFQCSELFGEYYVYAACLNLCNEKDIMCPLIAIHYTKSCPTLENRIMTLTKENKLTFVTNITLENEDVFINREVFPCTNGKCVPYAKVCDLIDDCGDYSDEYNCSNHFKCHEDSNEIIKRSQICNNVIDCSNAFDECNTDCPAQNNKKIISSTILQIFAWLIGIPSTFINMFVIIRNIRDLIGKRKHTKIHFFITILITLIACGDFLVGLYLVCISFENILRSEDFCKKQSAWLASPTCEFYGVMSAFGSQLSVFTMTLMSAYRAYVMRRLETSQRTNKAFYFKVAIACACVIIVSLSVAILPTDSYLQEIYFYNGYYIENAQLFLSPKRNYEFIPLIKAYYDNDTSPTAQNYTINGIKNSIQGMFESSTEKGGTDVKFNILGFYGSSGSCIFKYFVDPQDPQRHYTWLILSLNFLCFLVISVGYCSVHLHSQNSEAKVGIKARFGALQRKITFMIFTDFFCWFPFIIVCFVHYVGFIDATPLYPVFSIVVLPINSLVNPLLYDSFFRTIPSKLINNIANARLTLTMSFRHASMGDAFSMQITETIVGKYADENVSISKISQNDINLDHVTAC